MGILLTSLRLPRQPMDRPRLKIQLLRRCCLRDDLKLSGVAVLGFQ